MEYSSKKRISKYICPELSISPIAEMLTGISWNGETLLYRGKPVECVVIKTALNDFMTWLQKFHDVTIVAHNGRRFDFKVLSTAVHNCRLSDIFNSLLTGFCDSVIRSIFFDINTLSLKNTLKHIWQTILVQGHTMPTMLWTTLKH